MRSDLDIVKALLELPLVAGLDVNARSLKSPFRTPLMLAVEWVRPSILDVLLMDERVDMCVKDSLGRTAADLVNSIPCLDAYKAKFAAAMRQRQVQAALEIQEPEQKPPTMGGASQDLDASHTIERLDGVFKRARKA